MIPNIAMEDTAGGATYQAKARRHKLGAVDALQAGKRLVIPETDA